MGQHKLTDTVQYGLRCSPGLEDSIRASIHHTGCPDHYCFRMVGVLFSVSAHANERLAR